MFDKIKTGSKQICLIVSLLTLFVCGTNGCHSAHHLKKRAVSPEEYSRNVEKTSFLRSFFSDCMERKLGNFFQSWESILDYTVLDSKWYNNSANNNCLALDTVECWQQRLDNFLRPNSSLMSPARECIAEFDEETGSGGYEVNCINGRWTRFFNLDRPSGFADAEGLDGIRMVWPKEVCATPIGIDARLQSNNEDYRTANQVVRINATLGLICDHRYQPNGTRCLDYKVRFCCPNEIIRDKRQTSDLSSEMATSTSDVTFAPSNNQINSYQRCATRLSNLPSNRMNLSFSSVIELVQDHLVCTRLVENGDCYLNIEETVNADELEVVWPYLLEALTIPLSPIFSAIESCNEQIFPPAEIFPTASPPTQTSFGWSTWSQWDNCPSRCGEIGTRLRRRQCIGGSPGNYPCEGSVHEMQKCYPQTCPFWSEWNSWSTCSYGYRTRVRECTNGNPGSHGCQGSTSDTDTSCPFWSDWSLWSTCLSGYRTRERECINGNPGSQSCLGSESERMNCESNSRNDVSTWNAWSQYSSCSVTCGVGTKTKRRICLSNGSPAPGRCRGISERTSRCQSGSCRSALSGWSSWGPWEFCPAQCNQEANQIRRRYCTTGAVGSPGCGGSEQDTKVCRKNCGFWSNWSAWSSCPRCGAANRLRSRSCNGGEVNRENCFGPQIQQIPCINNPPCR